MLCVLVNIRKWKRPFYQALRVIVRQKCVIRTFNIILGGFFVFNCLFKYISLLHKKQEWRSFKVLLFKALAHTCNLMKPFHFLPIRTLKTQDLKQNHGAKLETNLSKRTHVKQRATACPSLSCISHFMLLKQISQQRDRKKARLRKTHKEMFYRKWVFNEISKPTYSCL